MTPRESAIARLAGMYEFSELREHFAEQRDLAVKKLGEKTYRNPEAHDRLEWEKLRAFHAGVDAVLSHPGTLNRKESQ